MISKLFSCESPCLNSDVGTTGSLSFIMLFGLLFLGAICYVAFRNKPDSLSFEKYYRENRSSPPSTGGRKPKKWLKSIVGSLLSSSISTNAIPPYTFHNCGVVSLVVMRGGLVFLGIFGIWIPLDILMIKVGEQELEDGDAQGNDDLVESIKKEAILLKTQSKCNFLPYF